MFSENNRISGRQMYRLMTYDLLGIGTLLVPQMLAKAAGRDGILSIGIGRRSRPAIPTAIRCPL